jgi:hypothetical protein
MNMKKVYRLYREERLTMCKRALGRRCRWRSRSQMPFTRCRRAERLRGKL